jgi:hypothetical protein
MRVWSAVVIAGCLSLTGCVGTYGYPDQGFYGGAPSYGYAGSSYGYGYQPGYAPSYAYQPGYVVQQRVYQPNWQGHDRYGRDDRGWQGSDRSQHVNQRGPAPQQQQRHAPPPAAHAPDARTQQFMGNMGFTPNR